MLTINNLNKSYDSKVVLDNLCLDIAAGDIVALVGENGAGKTTLLEIIMNLRLADSGTIGIFGQDGAVDNPAVRQRMGFLSETIPFFGDWTLERIIRFHRQFYPRWEQPYADRLIDTLQLDTKQCYRDLSRGQKLRFGLVATLSHHPELILLDEITAGMDPIVRKQCLALLKSEASEHGTTILFATNLVSSMKGFASHLVFLRHASLSPLLDTRTIESDDWDDYFIAHFDGEKSA